MKQSRSIKSGLGRYKKRMSRYESLEMLTGEYSSESMSQPIESVEHEEKTQALKMTIDEIAYLKEDYQKRKFEWVFMGLLVGFILLVLFVFSGSDFIASFVVSILIIISLTISLIVNENKRIKNLERTIDTLSINYIKSRDTPETKTTRGKKSGKMKASTTIIIPWDDVIGIKPSAETDVVAQVTDKGIQIIQVKVTKGKVQNPKK